MSAQLQVTSCFLFGEASPITCKGEQFSRKHQTCAGTFPTPVPVTLSTGSVSSNQIAKRELVGARQPRSF